MLLHTYRAWKGQPPPRPGFIACFSATPPVILERQSALEKYEQSESQQKKGFQNRWR